LAGRQQHEDALAVVAGLLPDRLAQVVGPRAVGGAKRIGHHADDPPFDLRPAAVERLADRILTGPETPRGGLGDERHRLGPRFVGVPKIAAAHDVEAERLAEPW
jgi:hypothetical protein